MKAIIQRLRFSSDICIECIIFSVFIGTTLFSLSTIA